METNQVADEIAEEVLRLTGEALLCRDLQAFRPHFLLPLSLETVNGQRLVEDEDAFSEVFYGVVDHMAETGVEDLVRTVIHADFQDPKTIRSIHVCNEIHTGGELWRPAYPVCSTLVNNDDRWQIVSCVYFILDNANHNRALVNDEEGSPGDAPMARKSVQDAQTLRAMRQLLTDLRLESVGDASAQYLFPHQRIFPAA